VIVLAIQSFAEGHPGRGAAYLAIVGATFVVVALAAAFNWSWISRWLYRLSLLMSVGLVLLLGNISDERRVAVAVALFASAFFAGLYAGRHESCRDSGYCDSGGDVMHDERHVMPIRARTA
jgi:hypothetical protein